MAFNLASITSESRLRAPRLILLGEAKVGKSSFAASSPSPIFIPIKNEDGLDDLGCAKFPVCQTFQDVMQCIYSLYSDSHSFQTVVLDSSSALEPLIAASACLRCGNVSSVEKIGGGFGKGWNEMLVEWRQLIEALDALREAKEMCSIVIGHTKTRRYDDPLEGSYDRFEWDVNEKAASTLYRWSDAVLFAAFKTVVKKEDAGFNKETKRAIDITSGQRFLYTQRRPGHPGGGRGKLGRLPYELPLNWSSFISAIEATK